MARIKGTVTQGGADAFAESEIQTALDGIVDRAYQVTRFLYEIPALQAVAGVNVEMSLTRFTQASMPNISVNSLIDKMFEAVTLSTSGAGVYSRLIEHRFNPGEGPIIVEDPIYLQIDSNATSATNTGLVVIEYEIVTISVADRLALLQQSLNQG